MPPIGSFLSAYACLSLPKSTEIILWSLILLRAVREGWQRGRDFAWKHIMRQDLISRSMR